MKRILALLMVVVFLACNNSSETAVKTSNDTLKTDKPAVKAPSTPPPIVTGAFAGELPCPDCDKLGVLLTLTETSYERTQHKVAPKLKADLLAASRGTCKQDSGFITLFSNEGKAIEWYRIISADSLEMVNKSSNPVVKSAHAYLLRKDGQKLVK